MDRTSPHLLWSKCSRNTWCKLLEIDTRRLEGAGVYVIWHGGFPSRVVRVGHGELGEEIAARRIDVRILPYIEQGPLFITWAVTAASDAEAIARYLEDRLHPRVAGPASSVPPLAVNSPF